ncbi:VanZ family protein [Bacillus spongiae]|uniref:VanZ family protein n=1 Tax=Bacillus spongiae TaxID=2683610 RepID=A0ABU8HIK8_9BACI
MKGLLKWFFTFLPIVYMIIIWILSSLPVTAVVELPDQAIDRYIKESLHLVEFAILYVLFVFALIAQKKFTYSTNLFFAIIAGLYGLVDEIHQSFIPYRSATLIDFVKDITGVAICYYLITRRCFHNSNKTKFL